MPAGVTELGKTSLNPAGFFSLTSMFFFNAQGSHPAGSTRRLGLRRCGEVRAGPQTWIRCRRRWLLDAFGLALLLLPLPELEGRLAGVGELTPFLGLQVVPQRHSFGMPETVVAQAWPPGRPVLRFAGRVVVRAIGPAACPGQLHRPPRPVPVPRPVEKLPAVVGVDVRHHIRPDGFPLPQRREHGLRALVPDGAVLGPTAEPFGECERMDVVAMGDGVGGH